MAPTGLDEFALSGERGIDVFRRVEDENHRRHRYECLSTVIPDSDEVRCFAPYARKFPERMRAAAHAYLESRFLAQRMAFGDPSTYPDSGVSERPIELFLYLDFFRSWQVGEQEIARVERALQQGTSLRPPEVSGVLRLLLDFNRLRRAAPIMNALWPMLNEAASLGAEDQWQNTGFALRMLGDLQRRSGRPERALAAYELSLALGVNAHRCGLAIEAAHEAGDRDAVKRHLATYEERWPLPEQLAEIKAGSAVTSIGGSS
ncbi:MAG: hypothetical protein EA407_01320 [Rhodobacteraceae bacterium]|nr:MAG: hypothetical protein EA407_01320 [Paracoccaceae bacterium]